jgi:SHS2 domain-containing protein
VVIAMDGVVLVTRSMRGAHAGCRRWHEAVAHTADVGLRAAAPDGRGLFEEAAAALAELAADVGAEAMARASKIELHGDDLEQLAFAWLSELIGLGEERGEALVWAEVARLEPHESGWMLEGRGWYAPYDETAVRPRLGVKAVTMHRLLVSPGPTGWALEAFLDV